MTEQPPERFSVLGAVEALDRAGADVEACTCSHHVVDYSDPERYHPENLDRDEDPSCPIHGL